MHMAHDRVESAAQKTRPTSVSRTNPATRENRECMPCPPGYDRAAWADASAVRALRPGHELAVDEDVVEDDLRRAVRIGVGSSSVHDNLPAPSIRRIFRKRRPRPSRV